MVEVGAVDAFKLVLATQNRHKREEIRSYFRDLPLSLLTLEAFPDVVLREDHTTLHENALQKARIVSRETGCWALADDTGLCVDCLGGQPGPVSSRYAGQEATDQENVQKLLQEMRPFQKNRSAFFVCVMALVSPDGKEVTVSGRLDGAIILELRGDCGFGYDPVFYLPDRHCTLAEISLEEKNRISHRGRALWKMRGILEGLIGMKSFGA